MRSRVVAASLVVADRMACVDGALKTAGVASKHEGACDAP
jgi:hypothetical protein